MTDRIQRVMRCALVVAATVAVAGSARAAQAQPVRSPVALSNTFVVPGTDLRHNVLTSDRTHTGATPVTERAPLTAPIGATADASAATTVATSVAATVLGRDRSKTAPWWAPVVSAALPGTGQFTMGQQRSVAYLVAEGYLVVQAFAARADYNRDRNEYRTLAAEVARRNFGTTFPIGPWEYYEEMEKFDASGKFDMIPGGPVDPETDETTFNGNRWLFARETYWSNPTVAPPDTSAEYTRAMAFYLNSAVRDDFGWSWKDAQLQKDVYRQTINSANRNDQRARNLVGLIGANHIVSMIDAYVSVRVRRYGGVRVAGMQLDGLETVVQPLGDPALGHMRFRSSMRFVPASR